MQLLRSLSAPLFLNMRKSGFLASRLFTIAERKPLLAFFNCKYRENSLIMVVSVYTQVGTVEIIKAPSKYYEMFPNTLKQVTFQKRYIMCQHARINYILRLYSKMGFTGVCIFALKHILWLLVRTASLRRS